MQDEQRFQQILEAARSRSSGGGVDTMVVSAHLAQMRLFMVKGGVEFFANQDSYSQRREFIRRVVDYNELPGRLEAIIDSFLIDGRGLVYFRPSKELYRIHFFTCDQFRTFYDEEGSLEEVQIIYSFRVRPPRGFGTALGTQQLSSRYSVNGSDAELRWIRLRVFADRIEQTITPEKPEFGQDAVLGAAPQVLVNSLGFIPAVEVFNNRGLAAGSGHGEFDWLSTYVIEHDRMVKNIKNNLAFFGNPTLVSSRPKHDLLEPDSENTGKATISSNSGFVGLNRASTRVSEPVGQGFGSGLRVPRVIANVEAADRVGYIVPDAVSGDLTGYAQQYQEMIRAALGGVDDLSISSGATAFEVRTLYGRVAATALKKCRDLFEYGFCKIFSMMLFNEEVLFRESLAHALGLEKPAPVLEEAIEPELLEKAQEDYFKAMEQWQVAVAEALQQIKETGEIPQGVVGLLPDGDTRVSFRHMGEIFPDSPQEVLNNSMVCRNLQELGVSSIEALQYLFPQKTPEERAAMLSGYPFRMVEATQRSVGVFMDILRGMFQVPHPQEPDLPLAADPNVDLVPYIYRTLDFLRRELSYSGTYSDADPSTTPTPLSDADRFRAAVGSATSMERERSERRASDERLGAPTAGDAAATAGATGQLGWDSGWQPMAGGVSTARRLTDNAVPIPGLGGTLSWDPQRPDLGSSGQLAAGPAGLGAMGSPDLAAPTNFGLFPGDDSGDRAAGRGSADSSGTNRGAAKRSGSSAGAAAKRK